MKTTIDFGKIDFYGNGRRNNRVTVDMRLEKNTAGADVFAASANVWNAKGTDIVMGGQCFDDLMPFMKESPLFIEIVRLWRRNHLNDMHAGTERQEACLREMPNRKGNYGEDLAWLADHDLLYDDGYKYGSAWLYREISEDDYFSIAAIIKLAALFRR